ncbi:hypothetical protein MF628_001219 [Paenibacillus polymyxa]|uniref:hypothetical protein n=1 Tax=Paenibacillus polymyxa TaxID=1406 RepID=UPI002024D389|nr:hypothetical protein [Paenibacillus polymyxa]URJ48303.1 hypothetical protein MF628_001219 [Paenibacillus polymyxa]
MYETIFLDALEEDEQELFDQIDTSPLAQLNEQLIMLFIQERRHMRRVKQLEAGLTDEEKKINRSYTSARTKFLTLARRQGSRLIFPL